MEVGGRSDPLVLGGEVGLCHAHNDYLSTRVGFSFLASEGFEDVFGGVTVGGRLSVPTIVAPFIGAGLFVAYMEEEVSAREDGFDNDGDGRVDESDETDSFIKSGIVSLYPEVGIHLRVTSGLRLTFSGRYHVTTEGREHDAWVFNLGVTTFAR